MQTLNERRLLAIGLVIGCALFAGCQKKPAADCGKLRADNAVVEPDPNHPQEMVAYFDLHNAGASEVVLGGVKSTQFDHGELQLGVGGLNGNLAMKLVQSVDIQPGQRLAFAPGKRRVKLFAPSQHYGPGDQVELVLVCGKQRAELPVAATVRLPPKPLPGATADDAGDDSRAQVLKDGATGGGADATDDSRSVGSAGGGQ